jgi:hypothetical protein
MARSGGGMMRERVAKLSGRVAVIKVVGSMIRTPR